MGISKILKNSVSRDKQMQLAFGLMDTINANIIEIAKELCESNDREYITRAFNQFVLFDLNTCRAIEYLKHHIATIEEEEEKADE